MAAVGGRDDRGDPRDQGGDPGRQDVARRLQRLVRRRPPGAQRHQQRLPAPLRRSRARPRDGQPEPHHSVRGDRRHRARAGRRPRLQPPRGCARAVDRPLRGEGRPKRTRREANPTEGMEPEEALHFHILRRKRDGVEDWIDASVEKIGAVPTLNQVLLPAMKEVGDKFGAGELILPFVLQSAEVMKRAVARLELYLDKIEGYTKGTVVIATVFGDVHDIGKSLVNTILTNNGYTVVDLGKQVPISTILDAAVEHNATAIGLSALLVSTSKQMPACIQELHARGLDVPRADRRRRDQPQLRSAGALPERHRVRRGLRAGRVLLQGRVRGAGGDGRAGRRRGARGAGREDARGGPGAARAPGGARRRRPAARPTRASAAPSAPACRSRRRRTGARGRSRWTSTRSTPTSTRTCCSSCTGAAAASRARSGQRLLREDFQPRLERMWREQDYLRPRALLGYFPCNADGNQLIIWDPADRPGHRRARATGVSSPAEHDRICLADFYRPLSPANPTSSRSRRSRPATRSPS